MKTSFKSLILTYNFIIESINNFLAKLLELKEFIKNKSHINEKFIQEMNICEKE
jgi:hypothetical protein